MMRVMLFLGGPKRMAAGVSPRLFRWVFCSVLCGLLLHGQAALAVDPVVGIRSLAMGDSLRAMATNAEGMLLNPAGIAQQKQFAMSGFYSLQPQTLGHFLHSAVSDSLTQQYVAVGLYYTYFHETPHFTYPLAEGGTSNRVFAIANNDTVRSGNEAGLTIAVPFSDRFALGATLKYGYFSFRNQLAPGDLPPDFSYQNPAIDGDHVVDLGSSGHAVSFDVGATLRLLEELRIGIAGQNLWAHNPEQPTRLGMGLGYRFNERLLVAADAMIDFTGTTACVAGSAQNGLCTEFQKRLTYRLGGGGEYILAGRVPLRLGYLYDTNLSAHHVSGGLGYQDLQKGYGLDFSLRQRVSAGTETVLLLGVRVLKH